VFCRAARQGLGEVLFPGDCVCHGQPSFR
jgi:hypothetical protein